MLTLLVKRSAGMLVDTERRIQRLKKRMLQAFSERYSSGRLIFEHSCDELEQISSVLIV